MSSLIDSVGVVISYFVNWLSSLTNALISNPVLQLVFAIGIIFSIIRFILCLLIDRGEKKSNKSYKSTVDNTSFSNENDYYSHVSSLIFDDDDDITSNSRYGNY